jgi:exodeoxyribonuclease-5
MGEFFFTGVFVDLTAEQRAVFDGVLGGLRHGPQAQTVGGYAGTGKSVLVAALADRLPGFAVCAFAGKAAHVLTKQGVERAQTIHSLIYVPEEVVTVELVTQPDGKVRQVTKKKTIFHRRDDLDVTGVIVDEASMVDGKLYADLCSFGVPLVFVGDHGQLEPVGEDVGLMADPDFTLETIHRNANEIAFFGEHLRSGRWASEWHYVSGSGDRVRFISPAQVGELMRTTEQVIVAFNNKRVAVNREHRAAVFGRTDNMPIPGDRLIVLRNSRTRPRRLRNGEQVTAVQVIDTSLMKVRIEDGLVMDIDYTTDAFNNPKPEHDLNPDAPVPLDFAYAITAHKAQGSEWRSGVVIEQFCPYWDHKRWTYTAATRFKERVFWTHPKWK